MLKKAVIALTLILALGLLLASGVFGAPTGGQVSEGTQERGTGTSSQSVTTEGGNVTEVNVSGTSITGRWAGFFGNITGGLQITDSGSNIFYEWTVSDPTGAVVYASNGTVNDWSGGNIVAAANADQPTFVQGSATDNFTETFNFTGSFNSSSLDVASVPYTLTWQSGSQGSFETYALKSTSDDAAIWAAVANNDQASFKGAATVDYQLLAPADSSTASFNFYLELP